MQNPYLLWTDDWWYWEGVEDAKNKLQPRTYRYYYWIGYKSLKRIPLRISVEVH